jgi:hypothetical protein
MSRPRLKPANEQLVDDAAAAMRKTMDAARRALSVPKTKIDAMLAKGKAGKGKRK